MFKKLIAWINREPINLDVMDGQTVDIVVPCPPEHGARCNCTWY